MKQFNLGSISKNLNLLVLLAVLPALVILLYTGIEQRRDSIENARNDLLLLTQSMAEAQKDITRSSEQILSILSLLPAVQAMDARISSEIFKAVLEQNPTYSNITLTDLNGDVLASGKTFTNTNLADRKHFRESLNKNSFAAGEYIVSRVGSTVPAFAYAYAVLDKNNRPKAVLTMSIKLDRFARFHAISTLSRNSFVAATDHKGIRLFYYPPKENTNPVGVPIQSKAFKMSRQKQEKGIFIADGSDGVRRLFVFEHVRLDSEKTPYITVWAGIPEAYILAPANTVLTRNLMLMFLVTILSLFISRVIGKKTLTSPIKNLVTMTQKFTQGNFVAPTKPAAMPDEIRTLTEAFHDMSETLLANQGMLKENEARFRLVMNSLDALVYVADMDTYEILFINKYGKERFGDITGKTCWQSLQKGQQGPCSFCTNKYLLDKSGKPRKIYTWEFQNTISEKWFSIHDRAIKWVDDRIVRLEIATDITKRKMAKNKLAEEKERLAVTLRSIGDGVITTDTEGNVVLINKVAEELTGWNSEDAAGQPLAEVFNIINAMTRQSCENPVTKVMNSGEIIGLAHDTALISKDGQEKSIADSAAPIRDKDNKTIGIVLVFRDITEQLLIEQEMTKVEKLESIGVLAGGIAHDFNNILSAILGNIDLSLLDSNLSATTQKLLREAVKASHRARSLTQQLLTFAKGGEPIIEAESLVDVIKDSADFVLRGSNVACRYIFPDDLWLVDIDKGQISQVVQNIILNASGAMPEGGTVEVSCKNISSENSIGISLPSTGNYVKMSIEDSGTGIPSNVMEKIFDPYFSTKRRGSGLGLATTHSIVSKHNGHISVQSTPGLGTTFAVFLPASNQSSAITDSLEEKDLRSSTLR